MFVAEFENAFGAVTGDVGAAAVDLNKSDLVELLLVVGGWHGSCWFNWAFGKAKP